MKPNMQVTSWRGVQLEHPAQWELMRANGLGEPGCCVFADRFYQRLQLQWQKLTYVPRMDLLLQKFREKSKDDDVELSELTTAPAPWQGIVRDLEEGCVVHAGRFFRDSRLLVEVTLVWPQQRDVDLENEILASIRTERPDAPVRLWQAAGLSVSLNREYELLESDSKVGKVCWKFGTDAKAEPTLLIERIALPQYWLDRSLGDWLESQLPKGQHVLDRRAVKVNAHSAQQLISTSRLGRLTLWRGLWKVRMDLGWQCPTEQRVYRVAFWTRSRIEQIHLPEPLEIRCCRPVPTVRTQETPG